MISQNRADARRQAIADQQWTTVQEEDKQNKELLDEAKLPCRGISTRLGWFVDDILHASRSSSRHPTARGGGGLRGLPRERGQVAAPAHLPGVREGRLL
jgi:hypothetical protein